MSLESQLIETRWNRIEVVEETGSTNADLISMCAQESIDGRVLVARKQTGGRGRHGREWITVPYGALTFSFGLRVNKFTDMIGWLPLSAGVAVADALSRYITFDTAPSVKWPNDVLIGNRKVAGVLSEFAVGKVGGQAVIGIGLNTSMTADQLPVPTATSIFVETAHKTDDEELLVAILRELDVKLTMWPYHLDELKKDYQHKCMTLGQRVKLNLSGDKELIGTAVDVDISGRLLIVTDNGDQSAVAAGDVTHLRLPL